MTTWQEFISDTDFIELRKHVDPEFENMFSRAYKCYIKGDWKQSGELLKVLIKKRPHDGPTRNLHRNVIEKGNCQCPPDWQGFRALTSK